MTNPRKEEKNYETLRLQNGRVLHRIQKIEGGKNRTDSAAEERAHGIYEDEESKQHFFIKQPIEKIELFTEFLAGNILKEFAKIDPALSRLFITAEGAKLQDGSYVLIQPKKIFQELYKIIYPGSTSRSERQDMMQGLITYPAAFKRINSTGLPESLFFSLLFGDYSVHSGNMVLLPLREEKSQRESKSPQSAESQHFLAVRIDWGAAFRYFGANDNSDIFHIAEYDWNSGSGWSSFYKKFTKNYITYYQAMPGLFEHSIPNVCLNFILKLRSVYPDKDLPEKMKHIILSALKDIPLDLLDDKTHDAAANYLKIPSFKNAFRGNNLNDETFAKDMANIICQRMFTLLNRAKADSVLQEAIKFYQTEEAQFFSRLESQKRNIEEKQKDIENVRKEFEVSKLIWQETKNDLAQTIQNLQKKARNSVPPPTEREIKALPSEIKSETIPIHKIGRMNLSKANACFKISLGLTVGTGAALGVLIGVGIASSILLIVGSGGIALVTAATIIGLCYSYRGLRQAGLFSAKRSLSSAQPILPQQSISVLGRS